MGPLRCSDQRAAKADHRARFRSSHHALVLAPVVEAFTAGAADARAPETPHTVASGLRVPGPIGDRWMLRVLKESDGTAVAVSDDALLAGTRRLAAAEGIFPAPEAGALVAAAERLRKSGWIAGDDHVVLFNTGTGLKYPECF